MKRADTSRPATEDSGFSLLEVLVAIAVIGTVMAAIGPFMVQSLAMSDQQRGRQVAIQVANDALERVRALDPSSLLTDRGLPETERQWRDAPTALAGYLADMQQAADPMLPLTSSSGRRAPLPTMPYGVTVNGVDYEQQWYVGLCWQTRAAAGRTDLGDCKATGTGVPFFRVVSTVTWPHRTCTDGSCLYVASTLVSRGTDPVFDTKRPEPTIVQPALQYAYVGTAVNLQLTSSGGRLPLVWTVTGLPDGLKADPTGLITGTPTKAGDYPVKAVLTDRDSRTDDSSFLWKVVLTPVLQKPAAQTSRTGTEVSPLIVALNGPNRIPLAWSATGLPTGLTISPTTGVISGTPQTEQTSTVTVTVTDAGTPPRTSSTSFVWRVLTPVVLDAMAPVNVTQGDATAAIVPTARDGLKPYVWTAKNLPIGVSMDATGTFTGAFTSGTRYLTTLTVTDAAGGTASTTVLLNVANRDADDLRVAAPDPGAPNESSTLNSKVKLDIRAARGSPPYTWVADGLPTGLTVKNNTMIDGTVTAAGTYTVILTATDSDGQRARLMFIWTVT